MKNEKVEAEALAKKAELEREESEIPGMGEASPYPNMDDENSEPIEQAAPPRPRPPYKQFWPPCADCGHSRGSHRVDGTSDISIVHPTLIFTCNEEGCNCKQYRTKVEPPTLPDYLEDDAPFQRCDTCARKTWDRNEWDKLCTMIQFDNQQCGGRFHPESELRRIYNAAEWPEADKWCRENKWPIGLPVYHSGGQGYQYLPAILTAYDRRTAAPAAIEQAAKYTMTFALSPDFKAMLLLKKPDDHKNPLFRGNWSVPGGKIEDGEDAAVGASRELQEESGLSVPPERMRLVTRIYCNCDPTETEHEVIVYGAIVPAEELSAAQGLSEEPVQVFNSLPHNCVWHIKPLFDLVIGRMKQPDAIEQARPQPPTDSAREFASIIGFKWEPEFSTPEDVLLYFVKDHYPKDCYPAIRAYGDFKHKQAFDIGVDIGRAAAAEPAPERTPPTIRSSEAEFQEYHKDAHEIVFHEKTHECLSATYYTAAGLREKDLVKFCRAVAVPEPAAQQESEK